jgi:hypothetical protein
MQIGGWVVNVVDFWNRSAEDLLSDSATLDSNVLVPVRERDRADAMLLRT